jgi:hypothetical protein
MSCDRCILKENHPILKNALLSQLTRTFSIAEIPFVLRLLSNGSTHSAFEDADTRTVKC